MFLDVSFAQLLNIEASFVLDCSFHVFLTNDVQFCPNGFEKLLKATISNTDKLVSIEASL